jgi:hypothetical protein
LNFPSFPVLTKSPSNRPAKLPQTDFKNFPSE